MSQSAIQSIQVPPRLRPGGTVAVCAPAGPVPADRLRVGLACLEARYRVRFDPDILSVKVGFLAGDDSRRIDEFNGYLRDPDVRAIVVARGGYGITRILPHLDADCLRRDPKVIVGFSDATALLSWALTAAEVRGIHGPVVTQLGELPPADQRWLFQLMEGRAPVDTPIDLGRELVAVGVARRGQCEGTLVGGNLCLLTHLVGTPFQLPTEGSLLFFEDVGERPYAVDRYLTHLSSAGVFDSVRAALVGDFTDCAEPKMDPQPDVWRVIDERLAAFQVPGLRGLPVGHGLRNLGFPFGGQAVVDFDRGEIRLLEQAVSD